MVGYALPTPLPTFKPEYSGTVRDGTEHKGRFSLDSQGVSKTERDGAGRWFSGLPLRHIQILNPSRGPDWGLFSFCFKGRWQGHPPFGDWALDAEWVSEWPASLFERPSRVTGRRKTSSHFQWVAAFMGSSLSRDNPVAETDTKAWGGQKDGSVAADPKSGGSVRSEPRRCQKSLMTNRLRAHSLVQCRTGPGQMKRTT